MKTNWAVHRQSERCPLQGRPWQWLDDAEQQADLEWIHGHLWQDMGRTMCDQDDRHLCKAYIFEEKKQLQSLTRWLHLNRYAWRFLLPSAHLSTYFHTCQLLEGWSRDTWDVIWFRLWSRSDHCEGEALAFLGGSGCMLPQKILKIETVK